MTLRSLAVLAVVAPLVAADGLPFERDFQQEDLDTGRDIKERIYFSREGGEFDEWRLNVGFMPALDRVQVKSHIKDFSYPGPLDTETDRVNNDPALPPSIELWWLLGDFEQRDHGWVYGMALEYGFRSYQIFYAVGTISDKLDIHMLGAKLQYAYAWYPHHQLRCEVGPLLGGGLMWSEHDLVDMQNGAPTRSMGQGYYVQGGVRAAVAWHPGRSQEWHIGAALDYLSGYGYSGYQTSGDKGDIYSELRFWWFGLGGNVFVGRRF